MRFLLAVLAFLSLIGAGGLAAAQTAPSDLAGIMARGEVRFALPTFDSPPFFYTRNGELEGSDIDMARDIAAKIGVKPVFMRSGDSFDDVVSTIAAGGADIAVCKLSRTLDRARLIAYTRPYLVLKHALALNRARFAELARSRDAETVIRDFTGRLGVFHGSSFAHFAATNFPKAEIVEFPTWEKELAALRAGEVVAAYRDEFEIKKILVDDPSSSLTLRTVTLLDQEDTLGMAVPTGRPQLSAFLDMYVANEVKDTSADTILARYARLATKTAAH